MGAEREEGGECPGALILVALLLVLQLASRFLFGTASCMTVFDSFLGEGGCRCNRCGF